MRPVVTFLFALAFLPTLVLAQEIQVRTYPFSDKERAGYRLFADDNGVWFGEALGATFQDCLMVSTCSGCCQTTVSSSLGA